MRLGVNIDHVATIRQQRCGELPDPLEAALVCEIAGATSIVCHLREDRRHIQDRDVRRIKARIKTYLNLEMSISKDIVAVALAVKPSQVTLVPERRKELTTEGGLNVIRYAGQLKELTKTFHARGIDVSLFIDPSPGQINAAQAVGVKIIELHTGRYADAASSKERVRELKAIKEAARAGKSLGLSVAAGHGLDYSTIDPIFAIPEIEEVNIGYSIVVRALSVGLKQAVREMVQCLKIYPKRRPLLHAAS